MKALIAMSGGVDSSVAAYMMKEKGYECIGCTMKLFDGENSEVSEDHTCCSLDDVADARNVCDRLLMPHYVFNFKEGFKEKVIDKFIAAYEEGKTPNPCIDCNRYLKFGKLFERAKVLGCDVVVTGHYARIEKQGEKFVLKKAADSTKDQSYVLYSMTQEQLSHTWFPLGEFEKSEIRKIAEENNFVNADKPDSQDICFVPDGDYAKVIKERTGKEYPEGDFKTLDGKVLGQHKGIIKYTLGQRKGLGISAEKPLYVLRLDMKNNAVILGDNEDLFSDTAYVSDLNWCAGEAPASKFKCKAKVRYRQKEQPAEVYVLEDGRIKIVFDEPQRAITPGQAAVLYDGDVVLGGGTIESL